MPSLGRLYGTLCKLRNSRKLVVPCANMSHICSSDIPRVLNDYMQNNNKLALLLDYDGTLTPIVSHPDLAVIPKHIRELLNRLSEIESVFVAIISGRAVANVKKLVGLDHLHYAGNHGYEILNPDGSMYIHKIPPELEKKLKDMVTELNEKISDKGAWVEDKIYSITYHFRAVPKELQPSYEQQAREIMGKSGFRVTHAHYGLEAKPPIDWNKGTAALKIMETYYGENWKNDVKVIFMGDDTTDEDAMKALKGVGKSFRISPDPNVETYGDYILSSTDQVVDILKWLEERLSKK